MDQELPEEVSSGLHHFFNSFQKIEPFVKWTVIVDPEYLKEELGYKQTHLFLGSMLACYPLGLIMHLLPYGKIRHVFSLVVGFLLLQICWGVHWIHTPLVSMIVYAMMQKCPRDKVQQVVPTFVMFYMAMAHFQHQYTVTDYLGLDVYFTCSHMILTQKLYMIAYNLHDGYLLSKKRSSEKDDEDKECDEALNAAQSCSQYALKECPTLLEYLGYTFCFSTVLVGPAFEFSQYLKTCDGSLHYKINKDGTRQLRGKAIPNNILPTIIPLAKAFLLITFASVFDRACNYRRLLTPWYFNLSTDRRMFFNWMTNFVQRMKVYFTWLFAEGSNNIWYVGFDGYDEDTSEPKDWTVACGAHIWQLETCPSVKVGTKAWNRKTSEWLLKYVYIRNKNRLGIVYAVSAIWHGFYPGYYMLATFIWLMSQCERLGRRKISPYFTAEKWTLYGVLCIFTVHSLGSYSTTAFFLRSFENVTENWRSHHFWGHIACVVFYVLVSQLPDPPKNLVAQRDRDKNGGLTTAELRTLGLKSHIIETPRKVLFSDDHALEMKYS